MNLASGDQILQLIAWLLALVEFILALYVLLLNAWHTANRHVSALLFLSALSGYALGAFTGVTDVSQATFPTLLLAATSPAIQPLIFIVTVLLLKPSWRNRGRWIWRLIYGLTLLPILLTLIDWRLDTGLWYTGLSAETYSGGYVPISDYTAGNLAPILRTLNTYIMGTLSIVPILYVVLRDKQAPPSTKRLSKIFLGTYALALTFQLGLRNLINPEIATLVASTIFALSYAYAGFQQMISERRLQRGRLQTRLTILMLGVTLPLIFAVVRFVGLQAGDLITQSASERLKATNQALKSNLETWLELNNQALQELVTLPDIISMDPERQKPILEGMAAAYPHMYLVSTADLEGRNVARSDDAAPKEYGDRMWHIGARNGAPLSFEVVIGRTSGVPAFVVSAPIRGELGGIIGVGMFAVRLTDISQSVRAITVGEEGVAYVVDAFNRVVAHPDPTVIAELRDYNTYPPVFALRAGKEGAFSFTDDEGRRWRAHLDRLENDWGVIVQQPESEFLGRLSQIQRVGWIVILVGATSLSGLAWMAIRQTLRPINSLTETATAIATGDLDRRAPIESQDEIGTLARAFNSMTEQLRVLIDNLESQVVERTQDLARRTAYLEAATEVSRAAASILESDLLIREVVEVIRQQFDLYYVGLFLKDTTDEWAVLRAGTGQAGQAMLAREHRIQVGEGMIGWSVAHAEARVALQAKEDAVRLATPELPETRSEAAIPLRSRGKVLGALSVQSTQPGAFDETTIAVLQTMADQVAVALENARLFAASQEALETVQRAYGEASRRAWAELLRADTELGFRSDERGVSDAQEVWRPEMAQALKQGQVIVGNGPDDQTGHPLAIPIKVGEQVIGVLDTYKPGDAGDWTPEETELIKTMTEQLELALESARLYQDTQNRALLEQLTAEIASQMRETLDPETVLRTAVEAIYEALGLENLEIYLSSEAAAHFDSEQIPMDQADDSSAAGTRQIVR